MIQLEIIFLGNNSFFNSNPIFGLGFLLPIGFWKDRDSEILVNKLVNELSKSVGGYIFYKNNYPLWEISLFSDYEEAKEFFEDNDEVIPVTKEEFKNLQNEQEANYDFNVFVRDWTTGDDEQSRYEKEKGMDVEYFITKYNVDRENALIMKELVDLL